MLDSPKLIDLESPHNLSPVKSSKNDLDKKHENGDAGEHKSSPGERNGNALSDEIKAAEEAHESPNESESDDVKDHSEAAALPDVASGLPHADSHAPDASPKELGDRAGSPDGTEPASGDQEVQHSETSPKSDDQSTGADQARPDSDQHSHSPAKIDAEGEDHSTAEEQHASKADDEFVLCSATLKNEEGETNKAVHAPEHSGCESKAEASGKSKGLCCGDHEGSTDENGVRDQLEQLNVAEGEAEAPATSKKLCSPS